MRNEQWTAEAMENRERLVDMRDDRHLADAKGRVGNGVSMPVVNWL